MKKYSWLWPLCIAVILAGLWGVSKRSTYTDIRKEANYTDKLSVAEMPETLAVFICEELETILPEAPVILKVSVAGDIEYFFASARQKVYVTGVFAGDEELLGQEIYLTCRHWSLSIFSEPKAISRGFVNVMEKGEEYLIFSDGEIPALTETIPVYRLVEESLISPVFHYKERENVVIPLISSGSTYVKYSEVKENEFFGATETAVAAWEKLKERMLQIYSD